MTSSHDRPSSSRDYEREAARTRQRLADNLDELTDRLTPGQVVDEMLTYSKASGGAAFRTFSNAMRENPIPSLLVGAGCMMFLSEKMGLSRFAGTPASSDPNWVLRMGEAQGSPSVTSTARSAAASASASIRSGVARTIGAASAQAASLADSVREATGAIGDRVSTAADAGSAQAFSVADAMRQGAAAMGDKASAAADATRIMAHDWRDQASGAAARAQQTAGDAIGAARDYSSSLGGRVADAAGRTRRQAADGASRARETASSFVSDQPLLSAALGIAVGAAIASLFPRTRREDQMMGETSDAVKEAASRLAAEQLGAAKESAAKIAQKAQDAVQEELTSTALADAPHNLADRIRKGSSESGSPNSLTEQTGLENLS